MEEKRTYKSSKSYFTIPIECIKHFKLKDLYLVAGLYSCGKYRRGVEYMETDTTIEQLASITGVSKYYIKDYFLPKLKKDGYILSSHIQEEYMKRRNLYTLPNPTENYRSIWSGIFEDNSLTPEEKGFLIGMYCLTANNSFRVDLITEQAIYDKLGISKNTYKKYRNKLRERGIIVASESAPYALRWHEETNGTGLVLIYQHLGHKSYKEVIREYTPTKLFFIFSSYRNVDVA